MTEEWQKRHPLLTQEETELLEKLSSTQDLELSMLRDAVLRLSALKVSEGHFPQYAAMIDETANCGFACLLLEKLPVGHGRLFWRGDRSPIEHCMLIEKKVECGPHELLLFARPCIRFADAVEPETRRRLSDLGRLCVTVRNLPLRSQESDTMFMAPAEPSENSYHIWSGQVVDFLSDRDGYGVHRQTTVLDTNPLKPITGLFGSGILDDGNTVRRANLGVFLANNTMISVDLNYPIMDNEVIMLDVGLVMARYIAKPVVIGPPLV